MKYSAKEIRERLVRSHISLASFCNGYGLPYMTVYLWLNGRNKHTRIEDKIEAALIDAGIIKSETNDDGRLS